MAADVYAPRVGFAGDFAFDGLRLDECLDEPPIGCLFHGDVFHGVEASQIFGARGDAFIEHCAVGIDDDERADALGCFEPNLDGVVIEDGVAVAVFAVGTELCHFGLDALDADNESAVIR